MDTNTSPYPLQLTGQLAPQLSRGLWLVKWLLAIPHHLGGPFDDRSGGLITFEAEGEEEAQDAVTRDHLRCQRPAGYALAQTLES